MDAKLNQSDLISLFAKGGNISVAKAESFVKNFFDLITEGLEQDGIVKINGLGTFKVTDVASRGSVNVNTGEKIEIKGHRKLTFIPADALKEQVNQPFAMFEPVEVDETYQPDYAGINEDEEVADAVADAAQIQDNAPVAVEENAPAETAKEEVLPEKSEDAATVDEPTTTVAEDFTEESVATDDTAELGIATEGVSKEEVIEEGVEQQLVETGQPVKDADAAVREFQGEPVKVQERPAEPVVVRVPKKKSTEEKQLAIPKRRNKRWSFAVIAIMVIAVGFVIYNRMESAAIVAEPEEPKPVVLPGAKNEGAKMAAATFDVPAEPATAAVAATIDTSAVQPAESEKAAEKNTLVAPEEQLKEEYTFVMVEELSAMPLKDITVADTLLYLADGELAEHIVAPDETLTKIARLYFGDKKLWPYIVKYNGMRDPNGLCSGMTISIPRLKPTE